MTRDQFPLYEQMWLSGQIAPSDFMALLEQNPDFAEWYNGRVQARRPYVDDAKNTQGR